MPHDCVVAGDHGRRLAQDNRFVDRLLVDDHVDELRLGLDHPAGMAVAQLIGHQFLQPAAIGIEHRLGQGLDGVKHRRLFVRLG
jgi:hypothetical protein